MFYNSYHDPISCLHPIFDFSKKKFIFFIFMHNSLRATSKSSLVSSFLKQKTFFSSNFKKFSRSRVMNPKAFLIWNRQWRTSFHYHFELQSDISKNNRLSRIGYKKCTSFHRRLKFEAIQEVYYRNQYHLLFFTFSRNIVQNLINHNENLFSIMLEHFQNSSRHGFTLQKNFQNSMKKKLETR